MKEAFNKYFIDVIRNHYFDFKEKMDKRTFSLFFLNWFIIYLFVVIISFAIVSFPLIFNIEANVILLAIPVIIMVLFSVFLLIPCFFACVRRQRDISEKNWFWYFFLLLIPFIGSFVYVAILCILPSENENNKR